jgi:diguanylate cyclase (GGDEF)-like protein
MKFLNRLSLRQMLTLPYIALVLLLTGTIGALSYSAGREAVDTLSDQLLTETVHRITQAVDKHVAGSEAVLETAFPKGVTAPPSVADALPALRTRFWLATSVHRDPNNYAYYGDRNGQFFGLWRHSEDEAELRLRTTGSGPRSIARFSGIDGTLQPAVAEQRVFEPRERPWFKAGQDATRQTWTSIYIDFKTAELVATRARRVSDSAGQFGGVVATDLSLDRVNRFLHGLPLSRNGLAFVVEADGNLIGVSRGAHLKPGADGRNQRLNASDSADPLVVSTYKAYKGLLRQSSGGVPRTDVFEAPEGGLVQVAHARMQDQAGLDWVILVAVPRDDFLHGVTQNFRASALLGVAAAVAVLLIGLAVLNVVSRDLRQLTDAAHRIGEGQADAPLAVHRRDEIGELSRSFALMQRRLLTDRLTGLSNREAAMRRIDERVRRHRRVGDMQQFAVLFVDLNHFKRINDLYGHDVGDRVLEELAARLRQRVRAADTVARYAGDEFLVLLDSVASRDDALTVRDHLEHAMAEPVQALAGLSPAGLAPADAPGGQTGAAIGLAVFPDDAQDVEALVRLADLDMYVRKQPPQR